MKSVALVSLRIPNLDLKLSRILWGRNGHDGDSCDFLLTAITYTARFQDVPPMSEMQKDEVSIAVEFRYSHKNPLNAEALT